MKVAPLSTLLPSDDDDATTVEDPRCDAVALVARVLLAKISLDKDALAALRTWYALDGDGMLAGPSLLTNTDTDVVV